MVAKSEDISYRIATHEDAAEICTFMKEHMYPTEPTHVALGIKAEDWREITERYLVPMALKEPISFVAVNSDGKIVGIRLSAIYYVRKRGMKLIKHKFEEKMGNWYMSRLSKNVQLICWIANALLKVIHRKAMFSGNIVSQKLSLYLRLVLIKIVSNVSWSKVHNLVGECSKFCSF